jgi:hypothetical protein
MLGVAWTTVNASTVRTTITLTVTAIATPPSRNRRVSRLVVKLKWEATPRQRWTETQATSKVSATASGPSSGQPTRSEIRS